MAPADRRHRRRGLANPPRGVWRLPFAMLCRSTTASVSWPPPPRGLSLPQFQHEPSTTSGGVGPVAGPPRCCVAAGLLRGDRRAQRGRGLAPSIDLVTAAVYLWRSVPPRATTPTLSGCSTATQVVPFQRLRRYSTGVRSLGLWLKEWWVVMGNGSGTCSAAAVARAGDLERPRVGGIDANRFRTVMPSVSVDFGEPNEAVNQMVASLPLVSASVAYLEELAMKFVGWTTMLIPVLLACASTPPRTQYWARAMIARCEVAKTTETEFRTAWLGSTSRERRERAERVRRGKDYGVLRVVTHTSASGSTTVTYILGRQIREPGVGPSLYSNRFGSPGGSSGLLGEPELPLDRIASAPNMREGAERVLVFVNGVLSSVDSGPTWHETGQ